MKGNGDVSSLNFEVILNDDKFTQKITRDIENAKRLNNEITRLLSLKGKLNAETTKEYVNSEKVAKAAAKTATEKAKQAVQEEKLRAQVEKTTAAQQKQTAAVSATNTHLLTTSALMRTVSQLTGITFGAVAIRRFVSSMIEITGQFELQKVALKTILRDAEGAERIFEQLYKFSSDSMYRFSELAKHAKQLAAFGIGQDDLLDTTKMLGDVAAGLGVSMDRLILAYGHVKSSGFLRGIQLRSFSQNGVPILDELAKMMTEVEGRAVSLGEVFDRMTKRQIDFAMVEEAFRRMTDEGGQFHNIQEQMARTLAGEINVLKGRWENLMYAMGEQTEGFVITIVRAISESISSLDKFKETLSDLWDAGSPVWKLYREMREWIGESNRNKGKGGVTSLLGGGYDAASTAGSRGEGSADGNQVEAYLKIANIVSTIKAEEAEIARLRKKASTTGLSMGLMGGVDETKELQAAIDARDEALKQYKDIMGVDYYKSSKGASKVFQERINDLKTEATFLKKLGDAYDKFEKYLGDGANSKMVEIFGEGDYSRESIESQIFNITDALRGLGKEGVKAAESIEESWGLDVVSRTVKQLEADKKAADDAQKSLKKYLDTMRDWADKNDANKFDGAIRTYYKALSDAEETARKAVSSLYLSTSDNNTRLMGLAQINGELSRSKANALKNLEKDLEKYAENYLKEKLEKGGYDLTDWGDKTLQQINEIKKAIEGITISDDVKNALLLMPGGVGVLAMFNATLERIKQSKIDKTVDPERFKKIAKQAKYIAERFLSVSNALKDFADASGNQALADAASRIGAIAQNIKSAYEGYKSAGPWGALIGGLSDLIEQALGGMTAVEQRAAELRDTIRDIRLETENQAFQDALLDGVDGIFGENFIRRLKNAVTLLDKVRKNLASLEYEKPERSFLGYKEEDWPDVERWSAIQNGRYEDMPFVTSHSWLLGDTSKTLDELAKEFNMEMKDKNGLLNPKLLQAILDTYGDLNQGAKDWLSSSIQYANQYAEALQAIDDATNETFNKLASDLTDKFIDNFLQMGNAVDDLSDTFADLGDAILRSFLQSYILDEILNKYGDEAKGALSKYANGEMTPEQYAAWLDGFANTVQEESNALAPAINGMIEAFKDRGLMNIDEETANSLGSGIKGITEETANLLASYINAIRADVSYIRVMQERGWDGINAISQSIPTLSEYLAQVSANTFDLSQSNQSILSELRSVIGAPGTSGMVVRVEYA